MWLKFLTSKIDINQEPFFSKKDNNCNNYNWFYSNAYIDMDILSYVQIVKDSYKYL